ncbi:Nuclear pore complex protein Nup160 [Trichoplax sp. H2]|nr:Nuclear pore complex protein Nup160 [Trichoplax sp. H2]|eukprot:RDD42641.1 Nuclear pore complex protein Nup160 [Trichoplax sp. H2]
MAAKSTPDNHCYRQIVINNSQEVQWKHLVIPLPDSATNKKSEWIIPPFAGGFSYKNAGNISSASRNRFILWRCQDDVIQLQEVCMDCNLIDNNIQLRFPNSRLLPDVVIRETEKNITLLLATDHSVHRFTLSHPDKLSRNATNYGQTSNNTALSILASITLKDSLQFCNYAGLPAIGRMASAELLQDSSAIFAVILPSSISIIILPPVSSNEGARILEIHPGTFVQRLISGFIFGSKMITSADNNLLPQSISFRRLSDGKLYLFMICHRYQLRIWSLEKNDFILHMDMNIYRPSSADSDSSAAVADQPNRLSTSYGDVGEYVGVFLCYPDHVQFTLLNPILDNGKLTMQYLGSVNDTNSNIFISFAVTNQNIWTLWKNSKGETLLKFLPVLSTQKNPVGWHQVNVSSNENCDTDGLNDSDVEEYFMRFIFFPGRFSRSTIAKAIQITNHAVTGQNTTLSGVYGEGSPPSLDLLVKDVISLMSYQIQLAYEVYDEISEEALRSIQENCWSKFCNSCQDFSQIEREAFGIFTDNSTGLACIIRRNSTSYIYPTDVLASFWDKTLTYTNGIADNIAMLIECIDLIKTHLTQEIHLRIEYDLHRGLDPIMTISDIAEQISGNLNTASPMASTPHYDLITTLEKKLIAIGDISAAISNTIELLDVFEKIVDSNEITTDNEGIEQISCGRLYSSRMAMRILSTALTDIAHVRFGICCDLLLLQSCILYFENKAFLHEGDHCNTIKCLLIPHTMNLLRAYYSIYWLGQQPCSAASGDEMEFNMRQLAALEISSTSGLFSAVIADPNYTLSELYLAGSAGFKMRSLLMQSEVWHDRLTNSNNWLLWPDVAQACFEKLLQIFWPEQCSVSLVECLVANCQYEEAKFYVNMVNAITEEGLAAREFMLGQCYLSTADGSKALECFISASNGIASDRFFWKLLMSEVYNEKRVTALYYMKVMRLFEQFSYFDLAIIAARTAINSVDSCDEEIPVFWSNIFKYYLELGQAEQAYNALASNPDVERQKDCLQLFVTVLCENLDFKTLCQFPYEGFVDIVSEIMLNRARNVSMSSNCYYDQLYSFHVFRNNFRKAACVMYECASRLAEECVGVASLQQQAKCYLVARNSLHLVTADRRWILCPKLELPISKSNALDKSENAAEISDITDICLPTLKNCVVGSKMVEVGDVDKDYMLVISRLQILQRDDNTKYSEGQFTPEETLVYLISAGLFDTAFSLARAFDIPYSKIFEGLAYKCCSLSNDRKNGYQIDDSELAWLKANDFSFVCSNRELSPTDRAWLLLEHYLSYFDGAESSTFYACVINKLLSLNCSLPYWLSSSLKKLDLATLLRLYIQYDFLSEATQLVMDYIDAVHGIHTAEFDLKNAAHADSPSVWLPYSSIDHLLQLLDKISSETELYKLKKELQDKLGRYLEFADKISVIKIDNEQSRRMTRELQGVASAGNIPFQFVK